MAETMEKSTHELKAEFVYFSVWKKLTALKLL